MQEYKNKNVLVTGGTGLIGRQVVDLLVEAGAKVQVISLDDLNPNKKIEYYYFNVDLSLNPIQFDFSGFDYVFHLAGIKSSPVITNTKPATMFVSALQANTNLLEACRVNNIPKVLFTSSIGAYPNSVVLSEENAYIGDPMDSPPGDAKRMAEKQIQAYEKEFGLKWVIVRLTNCYGIGDNFNPDNAMFIPSLMAKIQRGDNPIELWGDGSNVRDFAYSGDIARGILQMMLSATDTQPINLGTGEGHTVKEVIRLMQKFVDFDVKYIGGESGIRHRVLPIDKAKKLGYKPEVSLYDGLKATWRWFQKHPDEYKRRLNYFENRKH